MSRIHTLATHFSIYTLHSQTHEIPSIQYLARRKPFSLSCKMSSQQIASHRENAKIYTGHTICKQKSREILEKMNIPRGLLPLDEILEVGHNENTGFVWVKQKKSKVHQFRSIGRSVSYDTEVTGFVEDRRMRKVTGVKGKELLIWITVSDIHIQDPSSGKITFGSPMGITKTFPVKAFEEED